MEKILAQVPRSSRKWQILLLLSRESHFTRSIIHGIAQYGRARRDAWMRLGSLENAKLEEAANSREWSGVIGMITRQHTADVFASPPVPVVNVSNFLLDLPGPRVVSDDVAVGKMGAKYFLGRGFLSFAFCGGKGHGYSDLRQKGFSETISAAGFPCHLHYWDWQAKDPLTWLKPLTAPVAIMAANDAVALQIMEYCERVGIRVPEDIAVLGVDDDELVCEFSPVPISSVQLHGERIGQEAMALLIRMMEGKKPPAEPLLIPPRGIVVRQSTDVIAISDGVIAGALRYIRENISRPISIEDLLAHVDMSRRTFEQRFRRVVGHSPYAEILRARVDCAQEMLRNSTLPIATIAKKSGFTAARDLSVTFRKRMGMTPKNYRQQNRLFNADKMRAKPNSKF